MRLNKTLLSLLLAGLVAGPALAAQPPADLPPYGADKPLPVPAITKTTLSNGMEVWVVPREGLPRVDAVLVVRNAGLAADTSPGFAGMLAGTLTEGSARRDSLAIAQAAQGMGGAVSAFANNDGIGVSANALASHAADMIALLAEVARTPAFPDGEVALAKGNALQALKANEAQPGFRAGRAFLPVVFGEHPYARTQSTEASITAVTPEQLRAAHAQRFRPDRALLVITGRIGTREAQRLAREAFSDWRATGQPLADTPRARGEAAPQFVLLPRAESVQSTVRVGRPALAADAAEAIPLQLAGTILGGGMTSRLFQNLREDKGYTYGAYSGVGRFRAGGTVQSSADVRNEVTGAALTELMGELRRIGSEPVPAEELEANKRYMVGGYLISNQLQGAVAGTLAGNWLVGLPSEYLGEFVPKVRAVTAEQLQAAAARWFDPATQSIIVVGDQAAIAEQLKPFGQFRVQQD
ncbi:MAG: pitrilysin family protein [Pseudoxanthomonas suwonensis]|nr:pitrilysin family protein [Pseudoxanthomonas suwonensis]